MAKIESAEQLHQLEMRYALCQGALLMAQQSREAADVMVRQYMEMIAVLTGLTLGQGDSVTVDWKSGEVTVTAPQIMDLGELVNGVAAE